MTYRTLVWSIRVWLLFFLFVPPAKSQNTVSLTETERAWLQTHLTIRLGSDATFVPMEYLDEKDVHSGMSADYMALLEQRL